MIPKYTINLLSSLSRWLAGKSDTVWARAFGHQATMKHYAESLNQVIDYFEKRYPRCGHCNGVIGAPLLREVNVSDCSCVERVHVVDFAAGVSQTLTLDHAHTRVEFKTFGQDRTVLLVVRAGPKFRRVRWGVLGTPPGPINPETLNVFHFSSIPSTGAVCVSAAYDLK